MHRQAGRPSGLGAGVHVSVLLRARRLDLDGDGVEFPVTYAILRNHGLRKTNDRFSLPTKNHGLDAIIVVQVSVHGGDRNVMMLVLHSH